MLDEVKTLNDVLRHIIGVFDTIGTFLLKNVYELLFSVATFKVVDSELFYKILGRVQLVIGVFMLFQLVMIIMRGIVNPDVVTDSKSNGAANVVMRIMVSLALLALIVPINIKNPKNEYERLIRNQGVLFGTLYSLQDRILSNNTLGRLFLGDSPTNYTSTTVDHSQIADDSNRFLYTVLKMFYTLTENPNTGEPVCNDSFTQEYKEESGDATNIVYLIADKCYVGGINGILTGRNYGGTAYYRFSINPVTILVIPAFTILLFMMLFNVAKRVFQLAALQIMAPIPIISYMDPKGSKDGMFNAWVKLLGTTYLELFVQLGAIYFAFFILDNFLYGIAKQLYSGNSYHPLTFVVMGIAVFIFAKDAPKFLKQMLGIKDNGGKFFSAFGQAMGLGVAAISSLGSGVAGYRASKKADETRQANEEKGLFGRPIRADSMGNRAKHFIAGIASSYSGLFTGARAALNAKDHNAAAAWDAMQKQNAARMARGNDGSTLIGRMGSTVQAVFTGEGQAAQLERDIASMEARQKAMDAIGSRVSSEMVKMDWTKGAAADHAGVYFTTDGRDVSQVAFNHKEFTNAIKQAEADNTGIARVNTYDANGHVTGTYNIDVKTAGKMLGNILVSNENNYIQEVTAGRQSDSELMNLIVDARAKGGSGWDEHTEDFNSSRKNAITSRKHYKKTSEGLGQLIRDAKRRNQTNKANDQHSKDKK